MNYTELITFKKLLKKYIKETVEYRSDDIAYKINNEIMDDLVIILNEYLGYGKDIRSIIKNKIQEDIMSRIDGFIKRDKSNQSVVKLSTFKRTLNQLFNSYEN